MRYTNAVRFTLGAMAAAVVTAASGEVAVSHRHDNNPHDEGWQRTAIGTAVLEGPVAEDMGRAAWAIDDNGSGKLHYDYFLTPEQIAAAEALGWKLSVALRVVELPDNLLTGSGDGSPGVSFRDGQTLWQIHFGSDADGTPALLLLTVCCNDGHFHLFSDEGYHVVELAWDPVSQTAQLSVDCNLVLTDFVGPDWPSDAFALWGAFGTSATGHANFQSVQFSIGANEITDCNCNQILDDCEIALDPGADADGDGRLDTCDCRADIFVDGGVDTTDFLIVLAEWGQCDIPRECPADLNCDGIVNTDDFLAVLAAWGPCL